MRCRFCGNETGDDYPVCGSYECNTKENDEDHEVERRRDAREAADLENWERWVDTL